MFQEVTIIGTVGTESDMRYTTDGKGFCQIRVATNRKVSADKKDTTWFKVTAWDKLGENMSKFVHKGQTVHVIGRLVSDVNTGGPRIYTKQDGTPASVFEVVAREFRIVDFKTPQGQSQQYQQRPQQPQAQRPQAVQQPQAKAQEQFSDDIPW